MFKGYHPLNRQKDRCIFDDLIRKAYKNPGYCDMSKN